MSEEEKKIPWEPWTAEELHDKIKFHMSRKFFGKITLHFYKGEVPKINVDKSEIPPRKQKREEVIENGRGNTNAQS